MKDSTSRLSRATLFVTVAATALLLQAVAACGDTEQSSSSTNWLPCKRDEDCARFPGAHCRGDSVCIDARGEPIPATAEPATGGQSSTGGRAATGGITSSGGTAEPSGAGAPSADGGTAGAGEEAGSGGAEPVGGSGGEPPITGGSSPGGSNTGGTSGGASCIGWPTPMLDKTCQVDDDCFVAPYVFNCCGGLRMTSFNVSEVEALEAHRKACDQEPICDCISPNELDDGTEVPFDAVLAAECVESRCETRCTDGC